jgi:hypothetical protein
MNRRLSKHLASLFESVHTLLYTLCIAMLFCGFLRAQGETSKWYFGNSAAVDFQGSVPAALTNSVMNTSEGSASIADASGNLLFYTNGNTVWNASHAAMPNGTGLFGSSISCQSAVIVRRPSSLTLYDVFTMRNWTDVGNGAHHSIVDMSLDGGLGDVTTKNTLIYGNTRESLTAVCHANGTDYWIVLHDMFTNEFHSYHLTAAGLATVPVISAVGAVFTGGNRYGALKASPDGLKLAYALGGSGGVTTEVYDFDRITGAVSNPITLNNGTFGNAYGVEFSSNNQVLYICEFNGTTIQQVNLAAGSPALILASKTDITTGVNTKSNLQLAPDNKIYVCLRFQAFLGVIDNPNTLGVGCNYVNNAVSLSGRTCGIGLPNFAPCLIPIILPQAWTYFLASPAGEQVALRWEMEDVASVQSFQVERKSAGEQDFLPIGAVISALSGDAKGAFEARDHHAAAGENAYRIRAVLQDGRTLHSDVQTIRLDAPVAGVRLFPNPIDQDVLRIAIDRYQGAVSISAWDAQMRKVLDTSAEIEGAGVVELHTMGLQPGIYFITVRLVGRPMQVFRIAKA